MNEWLQEGCWIRSRAVGDVAQIIKVWGHVNDPRTFVDIQFKGAVGTVRRDVGALWSDWQPAQEDGK
jgi:hypothetical protein